MISPDLEKLLLEMEEYSATHHGVYAIPRDEGIFLNTLVRMHRPARILELGTSSGYSTIWLAAAAALYGGMVETVEHDAEKTKLAVRNFQRSGLGHVITVHEADAGEFLKNLEGAVQFVFMDTEKEEYLSQFKLLFPKLEPGGVVAADNAVDLADNMRDFLDFVKSFNAVQSVTVPIGNGLELIYRL